MKVKVLILVFLSLFCFSCTMETIISDPYGSEWTITSGRKSLVSYEDIEVKITVDNREPPSLLDKIIAFLTFSLPRMEVGVND